MPKTINDLNQQIQTQQAKAETEQQEAQKERDKAEDYRSQDNLPEAEAHLKAGVRHDEKVLFFQNENANLQRELQQTQARVNTLLEQRDLVIQTKDQEIARINAEISQLTGEPAP